MKRGLLVSVLAIGFAYTIEVDAQNAVQAVTPTTSAETVRTITEAVSQSAKDALKKDNKSGETREKPKNFEHDKK